MQFNNHPNNGRPTQHGSLLWDMVMDKRKRGHDLVADLQEILLSASSFLNTQRVSVWRFNETNDALTCLSLFDRAHEGFTHGMTLTASHYPEYFKALSLEQYLAVVDVNLDQRTAEFSEHYFIPNRIESILALSVYVHDVPCGIICFESVGKTRLWSREDVVFATAMADLVALELGDQECQQNSAQTHQPETLLSSITRDLTDYVVRVDASGQISYVNEALCVALNQSHVELLGQDIWCVLANCGIFEQGVATLSVQQPQCSFVQRMATEGSSCKMISWHLRGLFDGQGNVSGFQASGHDISALLIEQEKRLENCRVAAIANLASSLAHDFNNYLTPILSFTELAQTTLPEESTAADYLQYVSKSAQKAREMMRTMQIFGKVNNHRKRKPVYIAELLNEITAFIRSTTSKHYIFGIKLDYNCGLVAINPDELFQICSKLSAFATSQLPGGGELNLDLCPDEYKGQIGIKLELRLPQVMLAADQLRLIFSPFSELNQTAEDPQNPGLGLHLVHELVQDLGGEICCDSQAALGTIFSLKLPCSA